MDIGLIIVILIGLISLVGMGSILYSLICEKDIVPVFRSKPPQFYPQKIHPMDVKIKSILDDETFDINNWHSHNSNTETVILDP